MRWRARGLEVAGCGIGWISNSVGNSPISLLCLLRAPSRLEASVRKLVTMRISPKLDHAVAAERLFSGRFGENRAAGCS
jgi:hypothetical protein